MKNRNLFLWISLAVVTIGVLMHVLHVPGANYLIIWGLIVSILGQNAYIRKLNSRIEDLEKKVKQ